MRDFYRMISTSEANREGLIIRAPWIGQRIVDGRNRAFPQAARAEVIEQRFAEAAVEKARVAQQRGDEDGW